MMSGAVEIQALAADIGATAKRIGALAGALPPAGPVTRGEFAALEARVTFLEARWPQPGSAPTGVLVFTEDAAHDGPARELDGAVIDGAAFVHLDIPSDHVDRVRFTLDGAETSPGETKPPYDLYQPNSRSLQPLDLSEGEHRVEAIVSYQDGSERSAAAVFTVDHASAGGDPSPGSGPGTDPAPDPDEGGSTGPAEDPYNLFAWQPGDPSTGSGPAGPAGPAPWGAYEIPDDILDDTVRPRITAPEDLTGWSDYPDGAIVLLGPRHSGTLDFSNKRAVDFIPSSGRALVDRTGETEAFAVFASHAATCGLHNIDVRGGRGGIRLEDCVGCRVLGCDVAAAHVHGIWLAGGDCHHNEVAFTDSHDNGREKAYEKKPGDWRSLGHGYVPTNGAHHNHLHHYRGYRNWEDGIQLSPDCGPANVHEFCMVWWNNEDGVDTKRNRGNVFHHVHSRRNRYGGFNHHGHAADDIDPIVMESCSSYDENAPFEVEAAAKVVSSGGRYRSAKNSCLKVTSGTEAAVVSTDENFANGWQATARIEDSRGSRFTRATFHSDDDDPACLVRGDARDVVFEDCRFVGKTGLTVAPPATAAVN